MIALPLPVDKVRSEWLVVIARRDPPFLSKPALQQHNQDEGAGDFENGKIFL